MKFGTQKGDSLAKCHPIDDSARLKSLSRQFQLGQKSSFRMFSYRSFQ